MKRNLFLSTLAAFLVTLVFCPQAGAWPKSRFLGPSVEIGIIDFVSSDYEKYAPQEDNFMDLSAKSLHVTVNILGGRVPVTCSGKLSFTGRLGIAWDNYVFADKLTITKENGMIRPVAIDSKFKKSKFNTFSLKMPVMLDFRVKGFGVSGGVYGSMIISQHTKYKKPKHKEKGLSYMNTFQGGVTAKIRFKCVGVFANYALTNFFRHNTGPDLHPLTVGICLL